VDNYVIDDFSASIPSALEVLQNPHGDCNEHTVLYVALARAIGLPARTNVGLVYLDSEQLGKGFFYHAWPEVYVGEWLAIDPTLKQFPADATHLRFVQGGFEKQLPMLALIGQLKLEVQEVI
jgi:transglutaminase-like putative cysteine protease